MLQISVDYNVHISVKANPLSIRIEGLRGSLKDLEKMLSERRKVSDFALSAEFLHNQYI